jgi:hypothetical protein
MVELGGNYDGSDVIGILGGLGALPLLSLLQLQYPALYTPDPIWGVGA